MARQASVQRKTKETQIRLTLTLDGSGASQVATGVGFLDHMLSLLAKHALFDLTIEAKGDVQVDYHHTVEDVGICFGQAFAQALGEKAGITRFASASVPMDEALASVAVDLSGRPYLVCRVKFPEEKIGDYDTSLTGEFLQALATHAGANLHVNVPYGDNSHHIAEAIFKALALALAAAVAPRPRVKGVPSTKGSL
jgi:imidazoleglycerol-phosphate dehydratase